MMPKKRILQLLKIFVVLGAAGCLLLLQSSPFHSDLHNKKVTLKSNRIETTKACEMKKNIVFLKTHKTGGTTLARIIEKHAFDNKLNVVRKIGEKGSIHFGNANFDFNSKQRFLPPMGVEIGNFAAYKYNVFTLHARYNRPVYDAFMEHNALYITILRNPVTQFESSFDFFHVGRQLDTDDTILNKTQKIETFFEDPAEHWSQLSSLKKKYSYNNQIWDLGVDPALLDNDFLINYTIRKLDSELDFVLINELYDESLVIMKKLFCWEFNDILYLPRNQRGARAKLNEGLRRNIAQWNQIDVKMYNHFVKRLQDHIENYGPTFEEDIAAFRNMTSFLYRTCVSGTLIGGKRLKYETGSGNYTSDICYRADDSLSVCDFGNGYVLSLDLNLVCEQVTSDPRALNRDIRNMMKGILTNITNSD